MLLVNRIMAAKNTITRNPALGDVCIEVNGPSSNLIIDNVTLNGGGTDLLSDFAVLEIRNKANATIKNMIIKDGTTENGACGGVRVSFYLGLTLGDRDIKIIDNTEYKDPKKVSNIKCDGAISVKGTELSKDSEVGISSTKTAYPVDVVQSKDATVIRPEQMGHSVLLM